MWYTFCFPHCKHFGADLKKNRKKIEKILWENSSLWTMFIQDSLVKNAIRSLNLKLKLEECYNLANFTIYLHFMDISFVCFVFIHLDGLVSMLTASFKQALNSFRWEITLIERQWWKMILIASSHQISWYVIKMCKSFIFLSQNEEKTALKR